MPKKTTANDYVLQCRPGKELGAWVEAFAERAKLPVSETLRRLLTMMQCNFPTELYPAIAKFADQTGQEFQAACVAVRTALDSVNTERKASGGEVVADSEITKFIEDAAAIAKSREDAYFLAAPAGQKVEARKRKLVL